MTPSLSPHLRERTIAAIATGTGGGVGIIRVSGPQAEAIGRALCRPWPAELQSHHLYYGHAVAPGSAPEPAGEEVIDHLLFCLMRAPRSYTGEDVLELHGHGGAVNLQRLLSACIAAGAVPAEPGEFTRRAFLAGKLDLTRAEAIAGLVDAQSVLAARQAQRQLAGELGQVVGELRRRATTLLGDFEGTLDFPDLEADEEVLRRARPELESLAARVEALAASFHQGGRAIQTGIELALLGRTNAGKSSLINALCGAERVLVDGQPGTTRDYVEVRTAWSELPVVLIDTAGEREGATFLEQQGLRLGRQRWRRADLALLVVDGTLGPGPEEAQLLASLPPELPHLVVWNKADHTTCQPPPAGAVACSALCGWGLDALRQRVLAAVAPQLDHGDALIVTSARQAATLSESATALRRAQAALTDGMTGSEVVAAELRTAAARLGEISGDEVTEGVLDAIFARFCVGK